MKIEDLIINVLKTEEEIELDEGTFPITPFLAFNTIKDFFGKIGKFLNLDRLKAIGKIAKEKGKATLGMETGTREKGTVYKLTGEQKKVLKEMSNKYGKHLGTAIKEFRKGILAPYQLIKRMINKSSKVSSKDITGMTHEQFKSALESGRKKILQRGETYFEKSKKELDKIAALNKTLENLNRTEQDLKKGKIDSAIASKIYNQYGVGDEEFGNYSLRQLEKTYEAIIQNSRKINNTIRGLEGLPKEEKVNQAIGFYKRFRNPGMLTNIFAAAKSSEGLKAAGIHGTKLIDRLKSLWSGESIDLTKEAKKEFYKNQEKKISVEEEIVDQSKLEKIKKVPFNVALGKYFFRREILNQLKPEKTNYFKKTYLSIIDELRDDAESRKRKLLSGTIGKRKNIEFDKNEKKIWKLRPGAPEFSNKLEHYYQAIRDEDFLDKSISIKRSPKMQKAEDKIRNEIKKFEKKLKNVVSPEDYKKMRRYRLINNLISTKELKDPSKLFKSAEQIKKDTGKIEEKDYISTDNFYKKLKDIATMEFDSVRELNKAKEKAEELIKQMEKQGDSAIVDEYKDIINQIRKRADISEKSLKGQNYEKGIILDIGDIEELAKDILAKKYDDFDDMKRDSTRLNKMIKDYSKTSKKAEDNLEEIEFLLDKVNKKLERGV
jgi:hypothetical protein